MSTPTATSVRRLTSLATLALALGAPAVAHAARVYGERHITSDTVLHADQFGSVVIDADNVTLDCAGYQVHISSYTHPNCLDNLKCGIVADNRHQVTIQNCNVVGEFDAGIEVAASGHVLIQDSSVTVGSFSHAAVHVENADFVHVLGVDLEGGSYGLYLSNTASCTVEDVSVEEADAGLYTFGGSGNVFANDRVSNVTQGFYARDSIGELVRSSTFDEVEAGMDFDFASNLVILDNSITNCNVDGLSLDRTDGAQIIDNLAESTAACGAFMSNSTNSVWRGNTFSSICDDVPAQH